MNIGNIENLRHVHMVGIGGAGMSGIARILLDRGVVVSGSDMKESRVVLALRAAGATVEVGHRAENLTSGSPDGSLPDAVVTSFAAIPQDNPELVAAREAGVPLLRRSDVLALLMEGRRAVLMAGTHGKTSTTSMAVVALQHAGLDPSFAIGGQLNRAGTNAHHGTGNVFVAEADESDGSFLSYSPEVAVVTNIEPDHLDFFGTERAYRAVFEKFARRVVPGGALVLCLDDDGSAHLAEEIVAGRVTVAEGVRVLGYGTSAAAAAHPSVPVAAEILSTDTLSDGGADARVRLHGDKTVNLTVRTPGMHMVLNGVASLLAGVLVGAPEDDMAAGVGSFDGVRRRFEYHGTVRGVEVYDDYAHHPTEVRAVVTAAREKVTARHGDTGRSGRVVAVFQPHLYSRTLAFAAEFAVALSLADVAVVLDIYGAREEPVEGVDSRVITDLITSDTTEAHYEARFADVPALVASLAEEGDVVLTVGAGTVTMLADEILRALDGDGTESAQS